jgi:hypothetical protein
VRRAITAQDVARENCSLISIDRWHCERRLSRRERFIAVVTRCRQSSRRGVGWTTTTTKSNDDDDNTIYFWTGIRQSGAAKRQL